MLKTVALLVLLTPLLAVAQERPPLRDLMHARDYGMGGAYRAHGMGAESISGNPASLALFKRFQLELSGAWDYSSKFAFGTVALEDSATSEIAAGASYHLVTIGRGEEQRTAHLGTLALGIPLSERFHIGVSGRYLRMTGADTTSGFTFDAGVLLRLTDSFSAGVSGHSLIDLGTPDLQRYYALSFAYLTGVFNLVADIKADFAPTPAPQLAFSAGAEYVLSETFPVRLGYSLDPNRRTQFLSMGLGYITEGGGIDVAYRHQLVGGDGRLVAVTFKFQMK